MQTSTSISYKPSTMLVRSTLSGKYTWEVGPLKLLHVPAEDPDQKYLAAIQKALTYNCIIRAINSIHHHTPRVPPTLHLAFVRYSQSIYSALLQILAFEKEIDDETWRYAPERKYTSRLLLLDWGEYLSAMHAGKARFNAKTYTSLLEEFSPGLQTHFVQQVETYMNLDYISRRDEQERKVGKDLITMALNQNARTFRVLEKRYRPLFVTNHDSTGSVVLPMGLGRPVGMVSKEWREACEYFSSCDFQARPRELMVIGERERL